VGLSQDPGRAAQARLPLLLRHRPQRPPPPRSPACATPQPALVGGVRPPARRPDVGRRLLHRGDGLAPAPARPLLLEVGSRCVHFAGCTASPTGAWVVQQARQLAWLLQDGNIRARYLLRDRDTKFTSGFDEIFRSEGVKVIHLPYRSPRANAFAERLIGTARRELLDHLPIFGCRHLEHVMREFVEHYHTARPHQGLGQRTPWSRPPTAIPSDGPVERRDHLGGVLHEYTRRVA
jgi:hypothetical protein